MLFEQIIDLPVKSRRIAECKGVPVLLQQGLQKKQIAKVSDWAYDALQYESRSKREYSASVGRTYIEMGTLISRLLTWLGFDRMLGAAFDKLGIAETIEFKKTLTKTITREIKLPPVSPVQTSDPPTDTAGNPPASPVQRGDPPTDTLDNAELKQLLSHAHPIRDLSDLPPELAANPEVQKILSQAKSEGPYPASFQADLPPELARDPQVQERLKEGKTLLFATTDLKDLPPEIAKDPKIRTYVKMASGHWSPLDSKVFSWALFVVLCVFLAFALVRFVSLVKHLPGSR